MSGRKRKLPSLDEVLETVTKIRELRVTLSSLRDRDPQIKQIVRKQLSVKRKDYRKQATRRASFAIRLPADLLIYVWKMIRKTTGVVRYASRVCKNWEHIFRKHRFHDYPVYAGGLVFSHGAIVFSLRLFGADSNWLYAGQDREAYVISADFSVDGVNETGGRRLLRLGANRTQWMVDHSTATRDRSVGEAPISSIYLCQSWGTFGEASMQRRQLKTSYNVKIYDFEVNANSHIEAMTVTATSVWMLMECSNSGHIVQQFIKKDKVWLTWQCGYREGATYQSWGECISNHELAISPDEQTIHIVCEARFASQFHIGGEVHLVNTFDFGPKRQCLQLIPWKEKNEIIYLWISDMRFIVNDQRGAILYQCAIPRSELCCSFFGSINEENDNVSLVIYKTRGMETEDSVSDTDSESDRNLPTYSGLHVEKFTVRL